MFGVIACGCAKNAKMRKFHRNTKQRSARGDSKERERLQTATLRLLLFISNWLCVRVFSANVLMNRRMRNIMKNVSRGHRKSRNSIHQQSSSLTRTSIRQRRFLSTHLNDKKKNEMKHKNTVKTESVNCKLYLYFPSSIASHEYARESKLIAHCVASITSIAVSNLDQKNEPNRRCHHNQTFVDSICNKKKKKTRENHSGLVLCLSLHLRLTWTKIAAIFVSD